MGDNMIFKIIICSILALVSLNPSPNLLSPIHSVEIYNIKKINSWKLFMNTTNQFEYIKIPHFNLNPQQISEHRQIDKTQNHMTGAPRGPTFYFIPRKSYSKLL
jgi:hypothetical protein